MLGACRSPRVRAVVTLCWVAGTNTVVFADGSTFDADVVICCTGFCLTFPFLEEWNPDLTKQLLNIRSCLFKHAFHPMYGSEIVWIGAWCGVRGLPLSMSSSVWIVVQRAVVPACYAVHYFHDNIPGNRAHCTCAVAFLFAGFARPGVGSMPPIAEMMARYFALLVSEERSLPSVEEMQASIAADTERELGQYIHDGKRVSTLVDYMTVLTGEW